MYTSNKFFNKIFYYLTKYKLIRYLINGGFLFLIDFAVFSFFYYFFKLDVQFCQIISRSCSACIGFFSHKFLVFKNDEKEVFKFSLQFILFLSLLFFNVFFSAFLVYFFHHVLLIKNVLFFKVLTEFIIVVESYILLNFIFHKSQK